jgi:hypothetical protein
MKVKIHIANNMGLPVLVSGLKLDVITREKRRWKIIMNGKRGEEGRRIYEHQGKNVI